MARAGIAQGGRLCYGTLSKAAWGAEVHSPHRKTALIETERGSPLARLKDLARALKRDVVALWIAARSRLTPLGAKIAAGAVAAYALSPIDLIPDFVPVLGYLDDLVLVPLGIALAVRLIPAELMARFRAEAALRAEAPASRAAAILVAALWLAAAAALGWWAWSAWG